MPTVSIADALDLTLLAAEKDLERFDAMAQRWLCRLIEERSLTLSEVAGAAMELQGDRWAWAEATGSGRSCERSL
jgi:hypothetical protein